MIPSELEKQVIEAVSAVLGIEASRLSRETRLISDLNAESIDFYQIAFELRMKVGREVDFQELADAARAGSAGAAVDFTIGDVITQVEGH